MTEQLFPSPLDLRALVETEAGRALSEGPANCTERVAVLAASRCGADWIQPFSRFAGVPVGDCERIHAAHLIGADAVEARGVLLAYMMVCAGEARAAYMGVVGASTADIHHLYSRPISDLNLSTRAQYALLNYGLDFIGHVATKTEGELSRIPNCGKKTVAEIRASLVAVGLGLDLPPYGWNSPERLPTYMLRDRVEPL